MIHMRQLFTTNQMELGYGTLYEKCETTQKRIVYFILKLIYEKQMTYMTQRQQMILRLLDFDEHRKK